MPVQRHAVGVVCLFAAAFAAACSSQASSKSSAPPERERGVIAATTESLAPGPAPVVKWTGLPRGMMPVRKGPKVEISQCPGAHLLYWGGQVLQNAKIYNVNWTANVDPAVKAGMPLFYEAVANSGYFDWLSEYNTQGLNGQDGMPGSNQGISRGTGAGSFTINPSTCAGTQPCLLDDTAIQAELAAQIAAGALPAPTTGCDGLTDSIYMFQFPPNVTITMQGAQSCQQFCAYHFSTHVNGQVVPYGVLPDVNNGACAGGCGSDPTPLNNSTAVASHELIEATTDTDVGDIDPMSPGYTRPGGWGDNNCGEIGDICVGITDTVTVNGVPWTVQQEWSNQVGDCITTKPSLPPLCTGTNTPPGCRSCTCADANQPAGCTGATPWCETDATNVKHNDCVQCTTSSECASPGTCQKSSTPSQDDICSNGMACGAQGQPCCGGNACNTGLACSGGTCQPCGGNGQACCPGNVCNFPETCSGGTCTCTPNTCPPGACGTMPDGCGGTLNCGSCTPPQTCGGGGVPNQCGCMGTVCQPGMCGTMPDGCGGMIDCGSCPAPQTCGGGGVPNQCGCMPNRCAPGACGIIPDGCGGTVDCGMCANGQACVNNMCACLPRTCAQAGAACGTTSDGCGGMLFCGNCPGGESCVSNQCTTGGSDAGGTDSGGGGDASTGDSGARPDGAAGDSGSTSDSGSSSDSGSARDSGQAQNDSGASDGASAEGGGGGGDTGGSCGCRVAGSTAPASRGPGLLVLLGLTLAFKRRRSGRA